jgi:hypothetical protein
VSHSSARFALAAALLVTVAAGCLPEAGPPEGTRLVEERHLSGVRIVTAGPAGESRLLFGRRTGFRELYPGGEVRSVAELWTVPRQGPVTRLVDGVDWQLPPLVDALGRLWTLRLAQYDPSSGAQTSELVRVDPAGAQLSVGRVVDDPLISPGGTRVLYHRDRASGTIRELDDRETALTVELGFARFVGESFVFQSRLELWVLPPGQQQPVLLATDVLDWREKAGATELQLVLVTGGVGDGRPGPNGEAPPTPPRTLRLVAGTASRALWQGQFVSPPTFAPADDRLAVVETVPETGNLRLQVFHTGGDDHATFDLGVRVGQGPGLGGYAGVSFRPGSSEIWCTVPGGLRVVRADGSVLPIEAPDVNPQAFLTGLDSPDIASGQLFSSAGASAPFSADGRRWLYSNRFSALYLGVADDPAGTGLLIESRGDFPLATVRELDGGRRLLVTSAPPGQAKQLNLILLDPETNERRLLGTSVGPSVVGLRRIVLLSNEAGGLYDLHLIDVDTAADRLLAQNVISFAVAPACATCDPTGPGATVTYAVHARVPFKYDGLWRVELP